MTGGWNPPNGKKLCLSAIESQPLAAPLVVNLPVLKHQVAVHKGVRHLGVHGLA